MKLCRGGENKKTRKKKRKEQGILLLLRTSANHILFVCLFVSLRQDEHEACKSRHHLRLIFMALMHLKIALKDSARFFFDNYNLLL